MNWNDFIEKLKQAKTEKKNKGLSVSTIVTLIYSGAFDGMVENLEKNPINRYKIMFNDVTSALGSKASLPKKKKTEILGIIDIKNVVDLAIWRHQVNPFGGFSILDFYRDNLRLMGYMDRNVGRSMVKPSTEKTNPSFLIDQPSYVYDYGVDSAFFKAFKERKSNLDIIGVISDVKLRKWQNNTKEMLCITLFTGMETLGNLVIWPKSGENEISEVHKSLKTGDVGIITIIPNIRNNAPGGSVIKWTNL